MKLISNHFKINLKRDLLLPVILPGLLLVACEITGQEAIGLKESVIRKFNSYVKTVHREEVYVNTDRDAYISGEILWFDLYLTDRLSMLPGDASSIVYLEILNPENRPVIQKRIGMINGHGCGQAELPDSLSTGTYILRAYTNWMKNSLPENCFYRNIQIYNPDNKRVFRKFSAVGSEIMPGDKGIKTNADTKESVTILTDISKPDILEITVRADPEMLKLEGNQFLLFMQTHGVVSFAEYENITSEGITLYIPVKKLLPGICQITLFSPAGLPVTEKYVYIPDKTTGRGITITSEENFRKRSRVYAELAFDEPADSSLIRPGLSISVTPLTDAKRPVQLPDYMIFGSEYGFFPQSILKDHGIEQLDAETIKMLLLNIRSNWIRWDRILTGTVQKFKYPVEKDYHELMGTLFSSDGKPSPGGEMVWLSVPGKVPVFQYATTDSKGEFSFPVHIDGEVKDLIIQPAGSSGNYRISIESPFSSLYPQRDNSADSSRKKPPAYISDWSITNQVRKIYEISSTEGMMLSKFSPESPLRFYGKPDEEIMLDDFIKLPDMEEVFFEIVKFVSLKKKKAGYEFSVIDPTGLTVFDAPPACMIDGVIINDPDKIAALDPEQVEKIDVTLKKYIVGDYLFNGIINVITRKGDFGITTLSENMVRVSYRSVDQFRNFRSPDYSAKEAGEIRVPDLRNTLFWEPEILPLKDGKTGIVFWTGDIISEYVINVQGVISGGKFVSAQKIIRVK